MMWKKTQSHSTCSLIAPQGVILSSARVKAGGMQQTAGAVRSSSWLKMPQAISKSNEGEVTLLR